MGADHLLGQRFDHIMDAAGGGGAATFDGEEGFGHGDTDLAGVEMGDLAVASYDLHAAIASL